MKQRIYKYDNLKFFLIILVVFGHFIDCYTKQNQIARTIFTFIYSFHMPLFIFLTGLFTKKIKKIRKIEYKKINFYITLYFLMKLSMFIVSKFAGEGYLELFGDNDAAWFLFVVSIYYVLTPLINKFNLRNLFIFSIVLALCVGYDKNINSAFYLSRIIVFFPFYLLGYSLSDKKETIVNFTDKKYLKIISGVVIFAFIALCVLKLDLMYSFRGFFVGRHPYNWIGAYKFASLKRFITYIMQFIISFSILTIIPKKNIKGYTKFGSKTLQVYALHMLILIPVCRINYGKYLFHKIPTVVSALGLIFSILLSYILSMKFIGILFEKLRKEVS